MTGKRIAGAREGPSEGTLLTVGSALLAGLVLVSFMIGRYPVSPDVSVAVLLSRVLPFHAFWPPQVETVVLDIRLPRILAAMLVGAALSASGAAYQGVFRNPVVAPDILGASAGAGFGAALALLLGWSAVGVQTLAFGAGLLAVAATWAIGGRGRGVGSAMDNGLMMVLAGVIVAAIFQALTAFLKFVADPNSTLPAITFWLMGGLTTIETHDLEVAALPIVLGLGVLHLLRWRINLLTFGDDEARALGVDAGRLRLIIVAAATLATASAVAISGVIGLVGLVAPHLTRMVAGPNYRVLMPLSLLTGAGFLLLVDDLARLLAQGGEMPLGILSSLIGAPVFIILLLRGAKGWSA